MEVAAESGAAAITHRSVTEKAGLPLATVSYFFNSIDELVVEALRTYAEQTTAEQMTLAEVLVQQSVHPDEIIAGFAALLSANDVRTLAMFESFMQASRHPELAPPVKQVLAAARAVAEGAARAGGLPDPAALAPALTALSHGFRMHRLVDPESGSSELLCDAIRALLAGHLALGGHTDLLNQLMSNSAR